jgi:hypothetical protein
MVYITFVAFLMEILVPMVNQGPRITLMIVISINRDLEQDFPILLGVWFPSYCMRNCPKQCYQNHTGIDKIDQFN